MSNHNSTPLVIRNVHIVKKPYRRDGTRNIIVGATGMRTITLQRKSRRIPTLGLKEPGKTTVNTTEAINVSSGAEIGKILIPKYADAKALQNGPQPMLNENGDPVSQSESLLPQPMHSRERAEVKNEKVERISLNSFDPEALLSTNETAKILSLSPKTLANWRWMGKGLIYVKCGHSIRYEVKEIQKYIKLSRRTSTSGREKMTTVLREGT